MSEEKSLQLDQGLNDAQKNLVRKRTPDKYVKTRKGRGGRTFDYVEVGYVIDQLNEIFNFMWDFEVVEEKIGREQIWVKGKLTCHVSPEFSLTKTAYGGKDISVYSDRHPQAGEVIDIADDLKAAASDALKKCASLVGVASDVYWPSGAEEKQYKEQKATAERVATTKQINAIFAIAYDMGYEKPENIKKMVKEFFKLDSFTKLSISQASKLIDAMSKKLEKQKEEAEDSMEAAVSEFSESMPEDVPTDEIPF